MSKTIVSVLWRNRKVTYIIFEILLGDYTFFHPICECATAMELKN